MVTFGNLSLEEFHKTDDTNICKIFRISQLIIEYLLYWQDIYQNQVAALTAQVTEMNDKVCFDYEVVYENRG